MVTTAPAQSAADAAPQRPSDELIRRLNVIAGRIDDAIEGGRDTRERIGILEQRIEDMNQRQMRTFDTLEQRLDERLSPRIGEAVNAMVQPELASFRAPLEAQAVRLAAVENRLERVETIQVDSMSALDVRFGDVAYQTRLALAAAGLVTLCGIMVVLLR
ncbi:MAG: hypothetical protein EPO26_08170 [Chloroflexota bacterium]|nr:MAG: hypothetical protein EPO26_08170 [Chloroflexota bacterium]